MYSVANASFTILIIFVMRTCMEARIHTLAEKFYTVWIKTCSCCCLWKTERRYLFHSRRLVELRHAHKLVFLKAWLPHYQNATSAGSVWVISCVAVVLGPSVSPLLCSPVTCRNLGKPAAVCKCMNPHPLVL